MSLQQNDNDSMMALEALLNIKRDNVMSSACMVHPSQDEPRVILTPEHRLAVPNPLAVGSMAMPSRQELNRHGFSTSEEVRRSKIESALRSKPQRGRKRDDLSEEERMELTRTRNREHAKSTRVRKKARFFELLNREQQFEDFKEASALRVKRIESFQVYLQIRQDMLRARLGKLSDVSHQDRPLTDVVADGFNLEGQNIHHLDTSLVDQLRNHGKHLSQVSYSAKESVIAINDQGTGFSEVILLTDGVPFITAFTKFQFQTDSSKLSSMCWCPIRTAPRETLKSYPSVVSLDPTVSFANPALEFEDGGGFGIPL